jgi:hypothetical protein
MNVILPHSNHQHVLATHVAILRVVKTRIQIQLQCVKMTPQLKIMAEIYQWLLRNEITFINQSAFVGLSNKFYAFLKYST